MRCAMADHEPLGPSTLVKAVMHPFPYTVSAAATIDHAREMMASHSIHHLPVKEGASLVGVVADRDLRGDGVVGDVMQHEPYVVDLGQRLGPVLVDMSRRRIDCALVVKGERLAGILTATDACRLLGEHLELLASRPDDAA